MTIGKLYIGYRKHDSYKWKDYLIPKAYIDKKSNHHYYKYYYRWFNFFWCKPRKCENCGEYMTSAGGTRIWDMDGNRLLITICKKCEDSKEYIDKNGIVRKGHVAWLKYMWDKDMKGELQ